MFLIKKYIKELIIIALLIGISIQSVNDSKDAAHCEVCYTQLRELTTSYDTMSADLDLMSAKLFECESKLVETSDVLSFNETFAHNYVQFGEGHVFTWKGINYLVKLAE